MNTTFDVIPAIDLRGGRVVRLVRGDFSCETVYHADPPALAAEMARAGVRRLHVVDLDGARAGAPVQRDVVRAMIAASGLDVQVGGGIRSMELAAGYLEGPRPAHCARWVILGTAALRNPELVREACARWPDRILVGIDARAGRVCVEGWLDVSEAAPLDVVRALGSAGIAGVIYTDISRDGTGQGPNVEATAELAMSSGVPVIASGGVATRDHLRALGAQAGAGIVGVVVGKAILSGAMPLAEALACSIPTSPSGRPR